MADPHEFDDVMPDNPAHRGGPPRKIEETLVLRLVWMLLIGLMISVAQTVLGVLALIQFVILLINRGAPNDRIAEVGQDIGIWVAKAASYQCARSEEKPWPWSELD